MSIDFPLSRGALRWRCRRGTQELDLILNRYLEQAFDLSTDAEKICFGRLLDTQDDVLWDWLSGREMPEDEPVADLITRIRCCKQPARKR